MVYPGLVAAVLLGVSIGAFLYYMYGENSQPQPQFASGTSYQSPPYQNTSEIHRLINNSRRRSSRTNSTSLEYPDECTICLESLNQGKMVLLLPCSHKFHKHCINTWKMVQRKDQGVNHCPLCRRPYPEE